jgi:hypothetical protein
VWCGITVVVTLTASLSETLDYLNQEQIEGLIEGQIDQ